MANYIDGFVFPISRHRLNDYQRLADAVADIWYEHGALEYREFVSDDLARDGTRSFVDIANATDDEVVIFGWVTFESREARDVANQKVATDPRIPALSSFTEAGFDANRMAYAGFQSLPSVAANGDERAP